MKLLVLVITLLTGNVYADCLLDRSLQLEYTIAEINSFQAMDNYTNWMAEINKVQADIDYIDEWLDSAEEVVSDISKQVWEAKSETDL